MSRPFETSDEFRHLFPKPNEQSEERFDAHTEDIGGALNRLIIWDEQNLLIDGYRRLAKCEALDLPYETVRMSFENIVDAKIFVINEALSRRNLTAHQQNLKRAELVELEKARGNPTAIADVAKESGVSKKTVRDSVKLDKALREAGEEWVHIALTHERVSASSLIYICTKATKEERLKLMDEIINATTPTSATRLIDDWVKLHKANDPEHQAKVAAKVAKEKEREKVQAKRDAEANATPVPEDEIPEEIEEKVEVPEAPTNGDDPPAPGEVDERMNQIGKMGAKYMKEIRGLFDAIGIDPASGWSRRIAQSYREIAATLDEVQSKHGFDHNSRPRNS